MAVHVTSWNMEQSYDAHFTEITVTFLTDVMINPGDITTALENINNQPSISEKKKSTKKTTKKPKRKKLKLKNPPEYIEIENPIQSLEL